MVLILVTYPVWISPFVGSSDFPRVGWVAVAKRFQLSVAIESGALAGLVIGLLEAVFVGRGRWNWWLIAFSLGMLVVIDQQRLQPWVYQSILYSFILAGLPWREGRKWVIAVAVSIYFYSAAGKLDYQFVHTVGNQMVQRLLAPLGGVNESTATALAFGLPAGELTVALLIAIGKTRRVGGVCAIAMHLTLIGLLGPWSLGHSNGVLIWNALLAVQSWVLFVDAAPEVTRESGGKDKGNVGVGWVVRVLVLLALLAPLSERRGYWDHWTSWALYSPHSSRAEVQLHRSVLERMPHGVRHYLDEDDDGDGWHDLDLGRWSLQQRQVPIYPQARYQLAIALQLAEQSELEHGIRVKVKQVSDRWTGRRQESFLIGRRDLENAMRRYWLTSGLSH